MKNLSSVKEYRLRSYFIGLLALGLLAHGLVLINDGSYMDGWNFNFWLEKGQWDKMERFWYEQGHPTYYWPIKYFFPSFYNIYVFKALSFLFIYLTTVFQFLILARFSPLNLRQSFFVTGVAYAWPFYHWMVMNMFTDQLPPLMFYVGWYLYLSQREKGNFLFANTIPLLVLAYSFFYQGFYVYHYAFLVGFFLCAENLHKKFDWQNIKQEGFTFLRTHWLWIFFPLVWFPLHRIIFPLYGMYSGYYPVELISLKVIAYVGGGLLQTLFGPLVAIFIYYPLLPVFVAVLAGGYIWIKNRNRGLEKGDEPDFARGFMAVGFLMVLSIVYAHSANEKMAVLLTFQGRHSRYAGLGFGFLMLGCLQFLKERVRSSGRTVMGFGMFLVLSSLIYVSMNIYLTYQAHWAKNLAVVHHLKQKPPLPNVNIYFMRNQMPMGMGVDYHYADVSIMMHEAWGGEKYLGIPPYLQKNRFDRELISLILDSLKAGSNPFGKAREYLNTRHADTEVAQKMIRRWEQSWDRTAVDNFKPGGCLGEIIVTPKKNMYDFFLTARYLFKRIFSPSSLNQLYDDIADVAIRPMNIDVNNRPCPGNS